MTGDDAADTDATLAALATATTCRIVTRGRVTGREHVVSVWFALVGRTVYAASRHGHRGDWLRNAVASPGIEVGRGRQRWPGEAHVVVDPVEVERAVDAFAAKYARHRAIVDAWRAAPPVMVGIDLAADDRG